MTIVTDDNCRILNNIPIAVALGTFDGIHLGHQALIKSLKSIAIERNIASAIYTFDCHPLSVIEPGRRPPLLMNNQQKLLIFEQYGIDYVILKKFDKNFAAIPYDVFIKDELFKAFNIKAIIVGFDFTFGFQGRGTAAHLVQEGQKQGISVIVMPPVKIDDIIVSSSLIRCLISNGDVEQAARYLGRPFSLTGTVKEGHKVGNTIGFPTANLHIEEGIIIPKRGVYATQTVIPGVKSIMPSVTNIGFRPTLGDTHLSIETHVMDYHGDLYGKTVELKFLTRVRDEIAFASLDQLTDQIKKDVGIVRQIINFLLSNKEK